MATLHNKAIRKLVRKRAPLSHFAPSGVQTDNQEGRERGNLSFFLSFLLSFFLLLFSLHCVTTNSKCNGFGTQLEGLNDYSVKCTLIVPLSTGKWIKDREVRLLWFSKLSFRSMVDYVRMNVLNTCDWLTLKLYRSLITASWKGRIENTFRQGMFKLNCSEIRRKSEC